MSFVDMMGNDDWSDADMDNRTRATVESIVSSARQDELRTIMLGHISGMRTATAKEMGEIMQVKALSEAAGQTLIKGRIDIVLLRAAWAVERAMARISRPAPAPVLSDGEAPSVLNQEELDADLAERALVQIVIDQASAEVAALVALRNPAPPAPPAEPGVSA
jgi:hypothetical protein